MIITAVVIVQMATAKLFLNGNNHSSSLDVILKYCTSTKFHNITKKYQQAIIFSLISTSCYKHSI